MISFINFVAYSYFYDKKQKLGYQFVEMDERIVKEQNADQQNFETIRRTLFSREQRQNWSVSNQQQEADN